jgi:hypothetical protein
MGNTNRLAYSRDGNTWYASTSGNALFNSISALASNGYITVAGAQRSVGKPVSLGYSYDGITWTASTNGSLYLTNCNCVVWNGSLWLAGGGNATMIIYSTDGMFWNRADSAVAIFTGTSVRSIAWNGYMWVAIGGNQKIAYSYNGISWTSGTGVVPVDIYSLAWNGSFWIVVGTTGTGTTTVSRSYDGINWAAGSGTSSSLVSVASRRVLPNLGTLIPSKTVPVVTENMMVLVGYYPTSIQYSYDGLTWNVSQSGSARFNIISYYANCVAWNGTLWLVGGAGTTRMMYSTDGINWTVSASANALFISNQGVTAIAWNGSLWVAVATGGNGTTNNVLLYSTDGINWTASASARAVFFILYAVAWNGYMWVAGGARSYGNKEVSIGYSYDGITWTASTSGSDLLDDNCYCVAWNGYMWVAGGGTGNYAPNTIIYSSDGITWTASASANAIFANVNVAVKALAWNGYMWVAGGGSMNLIAYSYDGIAWTSGTGVLPNEIWSIGWNGSVWIAGGTNLPGTNNTTSYSYNGINWFESNAVTSYVKGIASRRVLPNVGSVITRSPEIKYGRGTSDASLFTLTVTFSRAFATTPTVTACVTDGSASWVSIGTVSSTGFTAYTWNASGGVSVPLNWQAIL